MHDTAYEHGRLFFALYGSDPLRTVVELGSQDVNGSLRDHCPPASHYIGLDVMPAKGVDLVVKADAPLPLASDIADAIVTSSAFEHDICFWDTFLELLRILRPGGLLYINAPANGDFHRYPLDCWRFYPDAGVALVQWAARRGVEIELIEFFIGLPRAELWADFVAVFRKTGGPPLISKACISDHAPAINIHHYARPPGAPLKAEAQFMPDRMVTDHLRAGVAAANQRNALLSAELSTTRQSTDKISAELAVASSALGATSAALAGITSELTVQRQRNDSLSMELDVLRKAASGLRRSLDTNSELIRALKADLADRNQEITRMRMSTSWRITAWLRWLKTSLRHQ